MKNLFLIILGFASAFSFSQTFNITWSDQQKYDSRDDYIEKLLYANNDIFFYDITMRKIGNNVLKMNFHTVNKMYADFKPLMSQKIFTDDKLKGDWETGTDLPEENLSRPHTMKSAAIKDGFFVFTYNEEDKKQNTYGYIKYSNSGKKTALTPYFTVPKETLSKYNRLSVSVSNDSLKAGILIQRNFDTKIGDLLFEGKDLGPKFKKFSCVVLNSNGSKVWENTFEFNDVVENDLIFSNTVVSANGNMLLFGRVEPRWNIKRNNTNKVPEDFSLLYLISNYGKTIKKINYSNVDLEFTKLFVDIKTSNFCLASSYNDKDGVPAGIMFLEIGENGEVVKTIKKPLPDTYLAAIKENEKLSTKKEIGRYIHINDVLFTPKNEIIIVGEYRSAFFWKNESMTMSTGIVSHGIWTSKTSNTYIYNYNDIYCMKIDPDRKDLTYFSRIPKTQRTDDVWKTLNSYTYFLNNKVYIFRNQMAELNNTGVSNRQVKEVFKLFTKTAELIVDIIDANGNHSQQSIYKKEEMERLIYPSNIIPLSDHKLLFTAANTKGRALTWFQVNDYFGIIEIKE